MPFQRKHFQKLIVIFQYIKKMKKIRRIKSAVYKIQKRDKVFLFKTHDKIVGGIVHSGKQPVAGVDNAFSVAPGKYSCE